MPQTKNIKMCSEIRRNLYYKYIGNKQDLAVKTQQETRGAQEKCVHNWKFLPV